MEENTKSSEASTTRELTAVGKAIERIKKAKESNSKKLDLSLLGLDTGELRVLVDRIRGIEGLEHLDLSGNKLTVVPDSLFKILGLKDLNLSANLLKTVDLKPNGVVEIPENSGLLSSLERLDLRDNPRLRDLPDTFNRLSPRLELKVNIDQFSERTSEMLMNHFENLGPTTPANTEHPILSGLQDAQYDRVHKALTKIETAKQTNSKELDLSAMGLTSKDLQLLIPDIKDIQGLERLNLSKNGLASLPERIGELSGLKELDLSLNWDIAIPDSIGNLAQLKMLNFTACGLQQIPNTVGNLQNLQILSLIGNRLREFPQSITQLCRLKSLHLMRSGIREVPKSIDKLTHLEFLNLKGNPELLELPVTMTKLSERLRFRVDMDQMSRDTSTLLINHFNTFAAMRPTRAEHPILDGLSEPQYSRISCALALIASAQESNATKLELCGIELTSEDLSLLLPSIQEIKDLQILDLSQNKLESLPAEIKALTTLKKLDLSHNMLTKIPGEIGALQKLEELDITKNALLKKLTKGLTRLSTDLDIKVDLEGLEYKSSEMVIDYFNVFKEHRMDALKAQEEKLSRIDQSLEKIFPQKDPQELWNQIIQTDLGSFQSGRDWNEKNPYENEFFSTYKVLKDFLRRFPVQDDMCDLVYKEGAESLLKNVLDLESSEETKQLDLSTMASAVGNCPTPVRQLLTQKFIGSWSGRDANDMPPKVKDFMMVMAVDEAVRMSLGDLLTSYEASEELAGLLHSLFLHDENFNKAIGLTIEDPKALPRLEHLSTNRDAGIYYLNKNPKIKKAFAQLCFKTEEDGGLRLSTHGKYLLDFKKLNMMVTGFASRNNIPNMPKFMASFIRRGRSNGRKSRAGSRALFPVQNLDSFLRTGLQPMSPAIGGTRNTQNGNGVRSLPTTNRSKVLK